MSPPVAAERRRPAASASAAGPEPVKVAFGRAPVLRGVKVGASSQAPVNGDTSRTPLPNPPSQWGRGSARGASGDDACASGAVEARVERAAAQLPANTDAPVAEAAKPASTVPPIAVFVDLEADFRSARDVEALRTALVTGARRLVPYDCALFVAREAAIGAGARPAWMVRAASGVSSIDRHGPFVRSFEAMLGEITTGGDEVLGERQESVLEDVEGGHDLTAFTGGFPHFLWLPVRRPTGEVVGGFAVFRKEPWDEASAGLLAALTGPFGHAHAALTDAGWDWRRRLAPRVKNVRIGLGLALLALILLAFPVRFSVLAPAEVVGARATPVASPADGVVREIFVEPGDRVEAGAALFALVDTKPRNDLEVAEKNRAVALAKYRRLVQSAVANHGDGREIAVARADLDVAEAEAGLARDLHERTRIAAPRAGVVVFSARTDWVGRPVTTGERVMEVVDPGELELKIDLGLSDALQMRVGTRVRLFLDGDPLASSSAEVSRIGYRPVPNAERQLVHRVFADFVDAPLRLGARGTARIDGERVMLGYYLFRRPIAALRQKIGL